MDKARAESIGGGQHHRSPDQGSVLRSTSRAQEVGLPAQMLTQSAMTVKGSIVREASQGKHVCERADRAQAMVWGGYQTHKEMSETRVLIGFRFPVSGLKGNHLG